MSGSVQKRQFCRVRRMSASPPIETGTDFGPCPLGRLTTPLPHLTGTESCYTEVCLALISFSLVANDALIRRSNRTRDASPRGQ